MRSSLSSAAVVALAVLLGCAVRSEPTTSEVRAELEPRAETEGDRVAASGRFVFHSNELLNLHHFLYQWARAEANRAGRRVGVRPVEVPEIDATDALAEPEVAAWRAAVQFYDSQGIARDLLFDGKMYALKGRLAAISNADDAWPDDLDEGFANALRGALPVYRAHWWNAHDEHNRRWIAALGARLSDHEAELADRMARAYGGTWPDEPMRVDVCFYANWAGAYTSDGPPHIVIASSDPGNAGDGSLETAFHEASHTDGLFAPLQRALTAAFDAAGVEQPRRLWHVFIFFTAGESVRRTLSAHGVEDYAHYGDRTGLYRRRPTDVHRALLAEHWNAFLDGSVDRAQALAEIAKAVGASGGK